MCKARANNFHNNNRKATTQKKIDNFPKIMMTVSSMVWSCVVLVLLLCDGGSGSSVQSELNNILHFTLCSCYFACSTPLLSFRSARTIAFTYSYIYIQRNEIISL